MVCGSMLWFGFNWQRTLLRLLFRMWKILPSSVGCIGYNMVILKCFSSLLRRRTYSANCFAIYWFYSHVYTSRETEWKKNNEIAYDEICANRSTGCTVTRHDACMFPFRVTAGLTFGQICVIILVSPVNFAFIVNAVKCDFHFGASKIGVHQVRGKLAQRVSEFVYIAPNEDITTTTRQIR